mgnify:CR=1 FL=1
MKVQDPVSDNIQWHDGEVSEEDRDRLLGQSGVVIWFTGLSGSGKSTIARRVESRLLENSIFTTVLDGDNIRHGLNRDLGFEPEQRKENIRRIGEVARLMASANMVVLTAFISPYQADRDAVRTLLPAGRFLEVYVDAPLELCAERDPKGLYARAQAGEIENFTGISAPYEAPQNPEIILDTDKLDIEGAAELILGFLRREGYFGAKYGG